MYKVKSEINVYVILIGLFAVLFALWGLNWFLSRMFKSSLKHFLIRLKKLPDQTENTSWDEHWNIIHNKQFHQPEFMKDTNKSCKHIQGIQKYFMNEILYSTEELNVLLLHYKAKLETRYSATPLFAILLGAYAIPLNFLISFKLLPNLDKGTPTVVSVFIGILIIAVMFEYSHYKRVRYSLLVLTKLIENEIDRRKSNETSEQNETLLNW